MHWKWSRLMVAASLNRQTRSNRIEAGQGQDIDCDAFIKPVRDIPIT